MPDPTLEHHKRQAGEAAAALVVPGMTVGLGTGSTVRFTIEAIGRRLATGALRDVVGVATSRATERLAAACGIPLADLADRPVRDLCIDGADEVSPTLDLIKGLGAALLREKIVATAARRRVIVVDAGKRVARLGTRAHLPVAVIPFAWPVHLDPIRALGGVPELRREPSGAPLVSDDGLYLLDCRFPAGIPHPADLEAALRARAGIVATGLFLGMTEMVFVAGAEGMEVLTVSGS